MSIEGQGLKGKARIPKDDLIPKTRRGRNQHSLAFQIPSASKDVYKYSFFPQTIRDWNNLPEPLISSSELSDDSVFKSTSHFLTLAQGRVHTKIQTGFSQKLLCQSEPIFLMKALGYKETKI